MTDITDDTALTLNEACRIYFRDAIKPASLKAEHKRGRLHMVKVGRTYFVTPAAIREMMVKQWQDPPSPQGSISAPKSRSGSSGMDRSQSALVAAKQTAQELKRLSRNTSRASSSPSPAKVIPLESTSRKS